MTKKIGVIHTSLAVYDRINNMIKSLIPDAEIINVIEDNMLNEVMKNGRLTPKVTRRICNYALMLEEAGADIILNACSSVAEAIDLVRPQITIPIVKIDEPMAELAVKYGDNIAVFGTVKTTLDPSTGLIESTAKHLNKEVTVTPYLIEGAFQVLANEHNPEKHNQMVLEVIRENEKKHDVIVLAQASMSILVPYLQELGKPVLFSVETGVKRVAEVLEEICNQA